MAGKSGKVVKIKPAMDIAIDEMDDDSIELDVPADGIDMEFMGSREDIAGSRTVASRERIRRQMEEDMHAFLSRGGAIQRIAPNVLADPPRKPSSAYGSRPI